MSSATQIRMIRGRMPSRYPLKKKESNPVGRPTKYCKKKHDIIIDALKNCCGRVQAASIAGIDYQTFLNWITNPELFDFFEAVKKAEEEAEEKKAEIAVMSLFHGMDKSWQAGAWWLERTRSEKYRPPVSRQEIDQKVDAKVAATPSNLEALTDEELRQYREIIRKLRSSSKS